jgi:XRE family aerobic/anaerobic benzoate catabolism transcriptional regulator
MYQSTGLQMTRPAVAQETSSDLIARLAARISLARKAKGFPRRVLSERSGVSPRYLAQLEAGEGNISVLLLERVARALDLRVDELLADERAPDHDNDRIAALYANAPDLVKERVRSLLAAQNPKLMRAGRICLVGLRGAGKSTLGQMAGEALKMPFVELNKDIESELGMPVAEVIALYGEAGFRAMEADALERITARHDRLILAVGGGLVAEPVTYARLLERFHTVWLQTSPAEHMQRVRSQGDLRPMEGNPAAMTQLKSLLEGRTPLYRQAEATLNTSDKTARASLNDLLAIIASQDFLGSS